MTTQSPKVRQAGAWVRPADAPRPRTVRPFWLQRDLAQLEAIVERLKGADLPLEDVDEVARLVHPLQVDLLLRADRYTHPKRKTR